jgi:hypothetical protein
MAILVNGVATLQVGTGTSRALETLGYGGPEGVQAIFRGYTDGIFTDASGPHVPEEEQTFSKDALIRVRLINFSEVILSKVRARMSLNGNDASAIQDGGADVLDAGVNGALWLANTLAAGGGYFRLLITSPIALRPWNFIAARLLGEYETNLGTKNSEWTLVFYARPVFTIFGSVTYNKLADRVAI